MLQEVTSAVVNLLPYVGGTASPAKITDSKMNVKKRAVASGVQVNAVNAQRLRHTQNALKEVASGMLTKILASNFPWHCTFYLTSREYF